MNTMSEREALNLMPHHQNDEVKVHSSRTSAATASGAQILGRLSSLSDINRSEQREEQRQEATACDGAFSHQDLFTGLHSGQPKSSSKNSPQSHVDDSTSKCTRTESTLDSDHHRATIKDTFTFESTKTPEPSLVQPTSPFRASSSTRAGKTTSSDSCDSVSSSSVLNFSSRPNGKPWEEEEQEESKAQRLVQLLIQIEGMNLLAERDATGATDDYFLNDEPTSGSDVLDDSISDHLEDGGSDDYSLPGDDLGSAADSLQFHRQRLQEKKADDRY